MRAAGQPFGAEGWVKETAAQHGLEEMFRPRGRPKKARPEAEQGS